MDPCIGVELSIDSSVFWFNDEFPIKYNVYDSSTVAGFPLNRENINLSSADINLCPVKLDVEQVGDNPIGDNVFTYD